MSLNFYSIFFGEDTENISIHIICGTIHLMNGGLTLNNMRKAL